jgi:hypothetical protein
VLAGKITRPSSYTPRHRPDRVKQANAVAPNFVHSLDAAALMMTVALASREGVDNFGMVHDSYAVSRLTVRCSRSVPAKRSSRCTHSSMC